MGSFVSVQKQKSMARYQPCVWMSSQCVGVGAHLHKWAMTVTLFGVSALAGSC